MDRFIEYKSVVLADDDVTLKSNMDRFIGHSPPSGGGHTLQFKIQYG